MTDRFLETAVISLAFLGWLVDAVVVIAIPISPGAQAVLYIAGFVALACTAALLLELYHERTGTPTRPRAINLLGSGMRFAFVMEFGLWLQSLRILTAGYAGLLVAGFIFLEFLFRKLAGGRDEEGM